MKHFRVHVSVSDRAESMRFYSQLFGAEASVRKSDYAKWMPEDPRVNFAISQRGATPGVQHVGIQVENHAELEEVYERLQRAARPVRDEGATTCCYAESEKRWIADPQGVQWETFLTTGERTVYGHDPVRVQPAPSSQHSSCCAPSCCSPRVV
jgi:predicted enzyme related to lactoylglutathione lyase